MVRKVPVVVKKGVTIEMANFFLHRLEEIGGRVRIEQVFPEQQPAVFTRQRTPPQGPVPPPLPPEPYCPWEDTENLGFFKAFFETIGDVLFRPSRFFSRMPVERGLIQPLIFALIMGVLGGIVGLFYQLLTMHFFAGIFETEEFGSLGVPMIIGSAVGLPIAAIVGVFVVSGIVHVCLFIVGGNRKGFEATFRVVAYATSTQGFVIIPYLGGLIGWIWALIIGIVGIRESHRISTGRAAFAVFLPLLAILVLLAILAAVIISIGLKGLSEFLGNY